MRFLTLAPLLGLASALCPYHSDASYSLMPRAHSERGLPAEGKKGVFLMNRIGPGSSVLYTANADGTNETQLLKGNESSYDYHAQYSLDGQWISFTSERSGDGQSDIYRVRPDGSDLQKVVATPSFEGASALSPDGSQIAYVSTANGFRSNIWVMDLANGTARNLTDTAATATRSNYTFDNSPRGHFRPSWSPDGQWIAFSSDRETEWTGHGNGTGWEHTQTLSIYVVRPDGTGFRRVAGKNNNDSPSASTDPSLGTPKWSPDGKRIVFYEATREDTWYAHRPESVNSTSNSIVSVDVATGEDRVVHASGLGFKMFPQWATNGTIGYLIKGGDSEGVNYTAPDTTHAAFSSGLRSPAWSPDGSKIVYEKTSTTVRAQEKSLYSFQDDWEYRFSDVFPVVSRSGSRMALTQKQTGNATSNIATMNPDGSGFFTVFDTATQSDTDASLVAQGLAGAFQPDWSPDDEWLAFGLGWWFQERADGPARIIRATANGSHWEYLTAAGLNSGYPSYSPDGRYIVYRTVNDTLLTGLNLIDLHNNNTITPLTTGQDNLPHFSEDGSLILFTRRTPDSADYNVATMKPDGSDVQVLTTSGANDAHAVWGPNMTILYNSGSYGFREEDAIYDDTFQPYGQIMQMDKDGSNKQMITDSMWEDSMPMYIPNAILEGNP